MKRLFAEHRQLPACQTFNDFLLRHLLVIFADMNNRYILHYEGCADEFASVTLLRLPFAAHQDNRLLLRESSVQAFNLYVVRDPISTLRLCI
ncbi:hypothetical protein J4G07_21800 [Candidatus Poribacteria bacterium]|nr:hypothetical protein [Candidatus Poribacteria bacterium]